MLTKIQFELAYRRAKDERGSSYDPWDVDKATLRYTVEPEKYDWVLPFAPSLEEMTAPISEADKEEGRQWVEETRRIAKQYNLEND